MSPEILRENSVNVTRALVNPIGHYCLGAHRESKAGSRLLLLIRLAEIRPALFSRT